MWLLLFVPIDLIADKVDLWQQNLMPSRLGVAKVDLLEKLYKALAIVELIWVLAVTAHEDVRDRIQFLVVELGSKV